MLRQNGLDARDERREERVHLDGAGRTTQDEAQGVRAAGTEATRARIGTPAEVVRRRQDAPARFGRDAGPVVQRERDEPLADARDPRHVVDGHAGGAHRLATVVNPPGSTVTAACADDGWALPTRRPELS